MIESKFSNMDLLHGELSQNKREQILKKFRELKTQYLITTDLSATEGLILRELHMYLTMKFQEIRNTHIHRVGEQEE